MAYLLELLLRVLGEVDRELKKAGERSADRLCDFAKHPPRIFRR